jgi:hypothetical protein
VHKTVHTRRPPKPTPKRNIPAWSSTISSSAPLFSHSSTSISQTPYQLPPAGPTCQPVFIPWSASLPRPTSFLANSAGARYVRQPSLPALSGEQEKEPEAAAQPRAPRRGAASTSPASLELPGAASSVGGRCRAGARRRARLARSCGGRRPLLHLPLLPYGASAAPGRAGRDRALGHGGPVRGTLSGAPPPRASSASSTCGSVAARSCCPPCSPVCEAASSARADDVEQARVGSSGPATELTGTRPDRASRTELADRAPGGEMYDLLCSGRRTGPRGWAGHDGGAALPLAAGRGAPALDQAPHAAVPWLSWWCPPTSAG